MNWLRNYLFLRRHMKACRALAEIVEKRKASFEVQDYARRRKAALKATRA